MKETMDFETFKKNIMKCDDFWFPVYVAVDPDMDGSNRALVEIMIPWRWKEKNCKVDVITESRDNGQEIYDWSIRCYNTRIKEIEAMKKELDEEG